jgi:hypothetical protein
VVCCIARESPHDGTTGSPDQPDYLRIRIRGDALDVYAIGLEKVPKRKQWMANPKKGQPGEPVFVSSTPLRPHLIEKISV